MDEEAKQLLREIRDAVLRREEDSRKANEQNLKVLSHQRFVVWLFLAGMLATLVVSTCWTVLFH